MSWYTEFDGAQNCCIPVCVVPERRRRFSRACRLVDVSSCNPQAYFTVAANYATDSTAWAFSHDHVYMEVFRKGREDIPVATYNVWRRDANGAIGFYFDDTLFATPGFYVGDVFINCVYCFSVQLRVPPCEAVVTDCYTVAALETCGSDICAFIEPAGYGIVGGGECGVPTNTVCGPVAPFFELYDPVGATAVLSGSTGCSFTPEPAGATSAG